MNLIELHILQSFPVTCLNRDDVGAPKSAIFGGVQRARTSSQSWKRAIRQLAVEYQPDCFAGKRTRYIIDPLRKSFEEKDQENRTASILAETIADALGKLDNVEKGNVKTLLYFSNGEINKVADSMLQLQFKPDLDKILNENSTDKEIKKSKEALLKYAEKAAKSLKDCVKDNADISIFGRMVADDHTLMLEGAGLFSHALSTHKVSNEIDFFSAVDDSKPEEAEGAGHIGTLEFNSACYYRYIGLNVDLLKDSGHLGHFSKDEIVSVIKSFLRASIVAVPQARKNSMSGFTLPAYVLGLAREGQPLSLVNAFENPVRSSKGYIDESQKRLDEHYKFLYKTYNLQSTVTKEVKIPENDLNTFTQELINIL